MNKQTAVLYDNESYTVVTEDVTEIHKASREPGLMLLTAAYGSQLLVNPKKITAVFEVEAEDEGADK